MIRAPRPVTALQLIASAGIGVGDWSRTGNPDTLVLGLATNTDHVQPGFAFVAQKGANADSHALVPLAVERGATLLVVDRDIPAVGKDVTVVRVRSTRLAAGPLAHAMLGNPTRDMAILGVTGTNGKTSTTMLLEGIFLHAGIPAGRIGTLGNFWPGNGEVTANTTPGPLELARILAKMREDGVRHVAMEVSSHALDQGRVSGLTFRGGALTMMGQDHLDYHGTMEAYAAAKYRLFDEYVRPANGVAAFNIDDTYGAEFAERYGASAVRLTRDARDGEIRASHTLFGPSGTTFTLEIRGAFATVRSPLVGGFNVTNMLAAAALADAAGLDAATIAKGLSAARPIPGRFERIDEGQPFTVVVDYAHTHDALERVLKTARRHCTGRVICLFGCGGNRDRGKRPLMGLEAARLADHVIVTSDNPRDEDPADIAAQAVEGILQASPRTGRHAVVLERRIAIERALQLASPGDVVVLAGKGHETYQEVRGVKHPFDDREVARQVLNAMGYTSAAEAAAAKKEH
jgi:UDP-N-acetylmuramoyl-L-alanyl-D-glutamate--2,6-diaminopimelate ligase